MNTMTAKRREGAQTRCQIRAAVANACERIAPTWPLDQFIAVNPWWKMVDQPFSEVSARIAALGHVRALPSKADLRSLWGAVVTDSHLARAAQELNIDASAEDLIGHLEQDEASLRYWQNVSDLLDNVRDTRHKIAWRDEITHQISQFCSDYFARRDFAGSGREYPQDLYSAWLNVTCHDPGISILMGERGLMRRFSDLPENCDALLEQAIEELKIAVHVVPEYAHALLLDINGWASWVAYLQWQSKLRGDELDLMRHLLAIRMAWELALWRHVSMGGDESAGHIQRLWRRQLSDAPNLIKMHREAQALTLVWFRASELAYQQPLHRLLARTSKRGPETRPRLQAAFCIDVRSEPFRRALEDQDPSIQTLGFAGFFGLPVAFQAAGTHFTRPQLPGLLQPGMTVTEDDGDASVTQKRRRRFNRQARWIEFGDAAPAAFSFIEALGISYAVKLLKDSFLPPARHHPLGDLETDRWQLIKDGTPLGCAEKADLTAGILGAMGLTSGFAPSVLLVGHGSSSTNNPHAAGLDCGACGGQTGEVNVRVLAQLLNDTAVRAALRERGVEIPSDTRFIAALHDTTTDEIRIYGTVELNGEIRRWLREAGTAVRRERAGRLGLAALDDEAIYKAVCQRARDWSQVRPEWGLADNAAFVVAPRSRTRGINLQGKAFLHDYDWRADTKFDVLELIMTAPMIVTHWINMQYNASVTDNVKYGSGNKVLHNVVGGHLGVFEGNGGDLRIGLAMQSLHDGEQWMHRPRRLSVYIEAPRAPIAEIAARHAVVRNLIDNDWIYLYRLEEGLPAIERLYRGAWHPADKSESGSGVSR